MAAFPIPMDIPTSAKAHRLIIQSLGVTIQENIFIISPKKVAGVKSILELAIALTWVTCIQAELEG